MIVTWEQVVRIGSPLRGALYDARAVLLRVREAYRVQGNQKAIRKVRRLLRRRKT